jgi:uncharacterized protein (TIGR00299 family) protein
MKALYFDVKSGASGDMILSSLIDIGVPVDYLREKLSLLKISGFDINVEKQKRSEIECSHLLLSWNEHGAGSHTHAHDESENHAAFRNPEQIIDIIKNSGFNETVFAKCEKILMRLAEAEAAVHGISVKNVHFHEIGAVDTIVDVAGICLCLEYLGIDRIMFSKLVDGHGTVSTRHGIMPVPVPAVAKLCEGYELEIIDVESELLTPTGCAVLVALGEQVLSGLTGRIIKTGYGCGDKKFEKHPNALRVFLMETSGNNISGDHVWSLESDMDHISGEIMGDAAGRLMDAGALDVSWCPVFMKKNRPGYRLTVLCSDETRQTCIDLVMLHTRTLGIRMQRMERVIARRETQESIFNDAPIMEKYCTWKNSSFSKPEYDSMAKLSVKTGKPVIELMEEYVRSRNKLKE